MLLDVESTENASLTKVMLTEYSCQGKKGENKTKQNKNPEKSPFHPKFSILSIQNVKEMPFKKNPI